jgi:hypothetical protein
VPCHVESFDLPYWLPRAVAGPSAGTDSPGGLESRSRSSSFISLGTMAPTATGARVAVAVL